MLEKNCSGDGKHEMHRRDINKQETVTDIERNTILVYTPDTNTDKVY